MSQITILLMLNSHSSPRHSKRPSNTPLLLLLVFPSRSAVRSQPQLTTYVHSPPPLAGNFPDTTAELLSEARAAFARIEREAGVRS